MGIWKAENRYVLRYDNPFEQDRTVDDVLSRLVRQITEVIGDGHILTMVYDDNAQTMSPGPSCDCFPDECKQAFCNLPLGAGSPGRSALERQVVVTPDIYQSEFWEPFRIMGRDYGIRSAWSVPIVFGEYLFGSLSVFHDGVHHPTERDIQIAKWMCGYAATALSAIGLKESQQRYKSLFEQNTEAIFSINLDGEITSTNSAGEILTGYTKSELVHMSYGKFLVPQRPPDTLREAIIALADSTDTVERVVRHQDGRQLELQIKHVPIVVRGEVTGHFVIAKDITEKKRVETSLAYAQKVARIGNFDWDVLHDRAYWSEEKLRIFGIQSGDYQNYEAFVKFVHPDDKESVQASIAAVLAGQDMDIEFRVVRPDCTMSVVREQYTPIKDEFGRVIRVVGTVQDITEHKQAEELLTKSEKLAVLGQLAAGIAHEIRNPLTALKGFVQLLQSTSNADNQQFFEIMRDELNRIESFVTELLILAKPQVLRVQPYDLADILNQVVTFLSAQAILHNVRIICELPPDLPAVDCDENRIKQVFVNIIKNAIEAMPDGGSLRIRAALSEDMLVLEFIDSGPGVPEEVLRRLGEPFYTTKPAGTGLGLMISQKIVESHAGKLRLSSCEGEGTTVTIEFPLRTHS